MAIFRLDEPRRPRPPHFALFALGFRPFYLGAALFGVLSIAAWILVIYGVFQSPLPGAWWHAHEMLFGFAAAVIVGFLFTAGRNWTGIATPSGIELAGIAGIWLMGRVAMLWFEGLARMLVDAAFLPIAAACLGHVLVRAGNRRNYFMVVILGAMSLTNLIFHAAVLTWVDLEPILLMRGTLALVVMLTSVMGGRVIPSFTENGLRLVGHPVTLRAMPPWFSTILLALTGLALTLWVLGITHPIAIAVTCAAALLQAIRWSAWRPWATWRADLVWSLHAGYFWLVAGLLLLAGYQFGWVHQSAVVHALSIGGIGGLIIAMITRTALGHTGRPLQGGAAELVAYMSVQIAVILRVATIGSELHQFGAGASAIFWIIAFLTYIIRYLPFLWFSRGDGQPG